MDEMGFKLHDFYYTITKRDEDLKTFFFLYLCLKLLLFFYRCLQYCVKRSKRNWESRKSEQLDGTVRLYCLQRDGILLANGWKKTTLNAIAPMKEVFYIFLFFYSWQPNKSFHQLVKTILQRRNHASTPQLNYPQSFLYFGSIRHSFNMSPLR